MPIVTMEGFNSNSSVAAVQGAFGGANTSVAGVSFVNGRQYSAGNYAQAKALSATTVKTTLHTDNYGNLKYWSVGIGVNVTNMVDGIELIEFLDSTGAQIIIKLEDDGAGGYKIKPFRGAVGLGFPSASFAYGSYRHLEIRVSADTTSSGEIDIRVDNNSVLAQIVQTSTGDNFFQSVRINAQIQVAGTMEIDDIIVQAGATQDADLGDMFVFGHLPDAVGNSSDWTPLNAGDNYLETDDPTESDDDATYVSSQATGDIDLYSHTPLPTISFGAVKAVQYEVDVRLLAAGSRNMRGRVRTSAAEGGGSTIAVDSTSWEHKKSMMLVNPANGSPWNASDIDGSEIGPESIA